MAARGIIEPSSSAWCSPVVMVTKKTDQSIRFCCDFRKINSVSQSDCQPLPRIDDTLDALSGNKWFSTLDMRSGYWQCGLEESDREKTAFAIPGSGLWQFRVLCFGLSGAPATFERLVEKIFSGLTWRLCMVYLDDIIVYSRDYSDHLRNLSEVCDRLRQANLKLHPDKCVLTQNEVTFLGHKVTEDGISTDDAKIKVVRDWPVPKNVKETRSFIGFCSYYRRFVKDFAIVAKPLHQLTEKGKKFNWTEACQEAFSNLKELLISAPVLGYPQNDGEFILDCDASFFGMGAVLSQKQNDVEKPIAYFSKTFSKCETNYCVTRKELLAIVMAIKNFHHYLYARKFTVRTDHGSLRWLMNFKEPEGQLARWLEELGSYQFTIIHQAGRLHSNADGLSRRPCIDNCSHCSRKEMKESCSGGSEVLVSAENSDRVASVESSQARCMVGKSRNELSGMHNEALAPSKCVHTNTLEDFPTECNHPVKQNDPDGSLGIINSSIDNTLSIRTLSHDANSSILSNKIGCECESQVSAVKTRAMVKRELNQTKHDSLNSENDELSYKLDIRNEQHNDDVLKLVCHWVENSIKPDWSEVSKHSPEVKYYWNRLDSFKLKAGVLYKKYESESGDKIFWIIVIPESLKASILQHLHDSAMGGSHLGVKKTLSKVRERYFWFGLRKFVERWCRKCDVCSSRKSPGRKPRAPMRQYQVGATLERVALDILGPLPVSESGHKYLLVIHVYRTKHTS